MARMSPVIPLVGAETRFQPVYVDDVALAAEKGVLGQAEPGIYELGGPEADTFRGLVELMLDTIRRRRLIVPLPFWIGTVMGRVSGAVSALTGGLAPQPITVDQVVSLRQDNVVSEGARTLADLGIKPTAMEAVLPSYLWQFRPSGQYAELKESARNLR
jgi:NADH dehydrogenase